MMMMMSALSQVKNLGNPMMCELRPRGTLEFLTNHAPGRFIALLPGSRAPEVAENPLLSTAFYRQALFRFLWGPYCAPDPVTSAHMLKFDRGMNGTSIPSVMLVCGYQMDTESLLRSPVF